jgi:hypothetical protein
MIFLSLIVVSSHVLSQKAKGSVEVQKLTKGLLPSVKREIVVQTSFHIFQGI